MWKRFLLAAVLIVALSAGATATVALNKVSGIAEEVFPKLSQINAPKGLVTPEYGGGPETFLILGSDRREGSQDALDRTDPPHSDTILLVRFDPEQGQTSVLSIPRDLMVNITPSRGGIYANEKINAAYTIGSRLGGTQRAACCSRPKRSSAKSSRVSRSTRSSTSTSRASSGSWTPSAAPT